MHYCGLVEVCINYWGLLVVCINNECVTGVCVWGLLLRVLLRLGRTGLYDGMLFDVY